MQSTKQLLDRDAPWGRSWVSACIDYVHFDDYGHCYCQIIEDYRGIAKMSYRLHRKKNKKRVGH